MTDAPEEQERYDGPRSARLGLASACAAAIFTAITAGSVVAATCSQPISAGDRPIASDCLVIIQTAVESNDCAGNERCLCSPSPPATVTASDALLCLHVATRARPLSDLQCECCADEIARETSTPDCTDVVVETSSGAIDLGWNGLGHGQELPSGLSLTAAAVKRCSDASGQICETAADCDCGDCVLTCSCDGASRGPCELAGPIHERRCQRSLEVCESNADCAPGATCEHFLGPPVPLSAGGTPTCMVSYFGEPITGTLDPATGAAAVSTMLRASIHLGVTTASPCPRCGAPESNPQIGDAFTCTGLGVPNEGEPCTVDGVSPLFGGVSFDCPPHFRAATAGFPQPIFLQPLTTGTVSRQATLPCAFPLDRAHPSGGQALCLDDLAACLTNADCTRCTDDLAACATNADCAAGATCASAPDQPIACGIYCHCGFCGGDDPERPCFSDEDCEPSVACLPRDQQASVESQAGGNSCFNLICGENAREECCSGPDCIGQDADGFGPTPQVGSCSLAAFRSCTEDADCASTGSGTCRLANRRCFESVIERAGNASAAAAELVGLFCMPPTSSSAINAASGLPGPGAIRLHAAYSVGRCGDGIVDGTEECDDGNLAGGDGCGPACTLE